MHYLGNNKWYKQAKEVLSQLLLQGVGNLPVMVSDMTLMTQILYFYRICTIYILSNFVDSYWDCWNLHDRIRKQDNITHTLIFGLLAFVLCYKFWLQQCLCLFPPPPCVNPASIFCYRSRWFAECQLIYCQPVDGTE